MPRFRYVNPNRENIKFLAENMREGDIEELEAGGWEPTDLGLFVRETPRCSVLEIEKVPCAVFGVAKRGTLLNPRHVPWMLGGTSLHKYPKIVLTESKKIAHNLFNEFDYLENWVYAESRVNIRWLKWLGFSVGEPTAVGPRGQEFCKFWKIREE